MSKSTILVVEDEESLVRSYSKFLSREGYEVLTANNGQQAIDVIANATPDLILLDLTMPVLDGVGFLEKSEVAKKLPNTKIIVFTNSEDDERIDKAFEFGASRYLIKAMLAPKELAQILKDELDS
ncbi:MAG: response regulator [Acidimicrobiia bacterium]